MECPLGIYLSQISPETTDILINGPNEVWTEDSMGLSKVEIQWSAPEYRDWAMAQLAIAGTSWDAKRPFVDGSLPGGWRLHAVFPPASPAGILVSLRRNRAPEGPPESRWGKGFAFLVDACQKQRPLVIAGATGSGKTTLLNDLLSSVPDSERLILLENTAELKPTHPHVVHLVARPPSADGFGEITLRDLLKQCLRMRPDRIVLGECRGAEVLDLLQALNTGQRGAMGTVHANSVRDAVRRLELLCALHGPATLASQTIRDLIASSVDLMVFVEKRGPLRHISEIGQLEGMEGSTVLIRPLNLDSV